MNAVFRIGSPDGSAGGIPPAALVDGDNRVVRRLFHKPSPEAPLSEVPPEDLESVEGQPGFYWLDLIGEDWAVISQVVETLGLEASTMREAVEEDLRPRVSEFPDYLFVALNGVKSGRGQRLSNSQVGVFIGERCLVTVSREPLPALQALQDQADQPSLVNLTSPAHLAAIIGMTISKRMVPLIEKLDASTDDLEELAFAADPRTLTEVHALRRDIVTLRRIIVPQFGVFGDLASADHPTLDKTARKAFGAAHEHHSRVAEYLDGARSVLGSVLETYRGAVADQTNEIVRVLTVFSATLLPLGLMAGLWGMNFANLPGSTVDWGFYVLIGAMALVAVGFWIYFSRRGFVGAPRLRDLPRSVGLGLVQIGAAPVRTVASGVETTMRTVGRYLSADSEGQGPSSAPDGE